MSFHTPKYIPLSSHQVVLTIGQNFWTAEVASGIQAGADGLKKIYDMHCKQLEAIVALVRGPQVCDAAGGRAV
jgi:hypothetical protein